MRICSKVCTKFRVQTTDLAHSNPIARNTLGQNIALADAPNKVFCTDITYIATNEEFFFLASVMDVYSRAIVGWSMSETMTWQLLDYALRAALTSQKSAFDLLHH